MLNRVIALCTELSVDIDPDHPRFVDMCTPPFRFVGGPNPHGAYPLAMISGDRAYRVTGTRGTSTYLGLQVLAGTGMNPRRMSNYLSDRDLVLGDGGRFNIVFAATRPGDDDLNGAQFIEIPDDATSIVVRDYIADPATEIPVHLDISLLGEAPPRRRRYPTRRWRRSSPRWAGRSSNSPPCTAPCVPTCWRLPTS